MEKKRLKDLEKRKRLEQDKIEETRILKDIEFLKDQKKNEICKGSKVTYSKTSDSPQKEQSPNKKKQTGENTFEEIVKKNEINEEIIEEEFEESPNSRISID